MLIYATVADVRAQPEVPDDADAQLVEQRIEQAQEQIDAWLGPWPILTNGAKIAEADVEPWQWVKLQRATVRLAARFYLNPAILEPATHGKVSGPDFTVEQPTAPVAMLGDVTAPLKASGLRITGARMA